jgi:hypothetical protein
MWYGVGTLCIKIKYEGYGICDLHWTYQMNTLLVTLPILYEIVRNLRINLFESGHYLEWL